MAKIYIPQDPRLFLNLYFMEFANSNHPIFRRHEKYSRIKSAVLSNGLLDDIRGLMLDLIMDGLINGVRVNCEVYEFVSRGTIRWRKYYRRNDCDERDDVALRKGVEDLLPPNKGYYVKPLLERFIQFERPRTAGELEELRRSLQKAGVPRCSKYATTQSVLDWVWKGYVPFSEPLALQRSARETPWSYADNFTTFGVKKRTSRVLFTLDVAMELTAELHSVVAPF
ncbi:MAG: hypothetical protein JZD41_01365 [Thermoproteus sp.]|nr:hypothetical protein [Thermoproteus sp.]